MAVVARHFALLQAAVERHNGVSFKKVGDALLAAFQTAPAAAAVGRLHGSGSPGNDLASLPAM